MIRTHLGHALINTINIKCFRIRFRYCQDIPSQSCRVTTFTILTLFFYHNKSSHPNPQQWRKCQTTVWRCTQNKKKKGDFQNTSTGGTFFPWKNYSCVKGHKGKFFSEIVWLIVFVGYHAKQYNYVMYVVFCQQRGGVGIPTRNYCTVYSGW